MNDNGSRKVRLPISLVAVLEIKPERELEIQLERGTLMVPPQRVSDEDVDLRTIEGSITRVDRPWPPEAIQCVSEMLQQ